MQTRSIITILRRELPGIGAAVVLLALTTAFAVVLQYYVGILRGSMLYLLPIMVLGYYYGIVPSLIAAVAGVILSGYLFFARLYSFQIASPTEVLNIVLFMVVAIVVSQLAISAKRHLALARKREQEMSDLYAFSRRLAAARDTSEICAAIEGYLTNLVQRKVVLLDGGAAALAAGVPGRVREAVTRAGQDAGGERIVGDSSGNTWLIRPVSPKTADFGVVAIDLGTISDIALADTRSRIDDALADAAATLERLDVARALNEAKMRSETELLREALIGSVSHELRTPLASILGAATVLAKAPALARDDRLLGLAGVVRDEAERLDGDIQNLLDASTITRQAVRPKPQWIEPVDIVNAALERRRRRLTAHTLSLDLDYDLPILRADPAQITQALIQIVDNAAKYSPPDTPIRIAARADGRTLVLSVHDQGAGLTDEERRQAGERFFRGSRHVAVSSGSGLGLWVANAFVTANGGKLEIESEGAGRGTTVAIRLPMPPQPIESPADGNAAELVAGKPAEAAAPVGKLSALPPAPAPAQRTPAAHQPAAGRPIVLEAKLDASIDQ